MKWILVTEPYKESSNGISLIHKIANKISAMGQDVYLVFYRWHPDATQQVFYVSDDPLLHNPALSTVPLTKDRASPTFFEESIVIYPDAVIGNPLSASRIVRYFGNKPGFVTPGHTVATNENEFVLSHSRILYERPNAVVFNADINECFYFSEADEHPRTRSLDLVYHGKGPLYGQCMPIKNALLIDRSWPQGRKQLAMLLKRCRYFYTYDIWSNINIEAVAAGAIPIILQYKPFEPQEISASELGALPQGELVAIKDENAYSNANLALFMKEREEMLQKISQLSSTWDNRLENAISAIIEFFNK